MLSFMFARGFLFLSVFSGYGFNYAWYRRISAPSRLEALGLTYLAKVASRDSVH